MTNKLNCKIKKLVDGNTILDVLYLAIFIILTGFLIWSKIDLIILNLYVWIPFIVYFYGSTCSLNVNAALAITTLRFLFYFVIMTVTTFILLLN